MADVQLAVAPTFVAARRRVVMAQIAGSALGAAEILATILPPPDEIWTFLGNFAGSQGKKVSGGVNPAASFVISAKKNGAAATGTITISTGGVVTLATTSGAAIVLDGSAGDYLQLVGATSPDIAVGYIISLLASWAPV